MNTTERILKLIAAKGITKKDFANAIGVSPSTISEWAANRQTPLPHISKIADYFGVSVDYLLGREKPATPYELDPDRTVVVIGRGGTRQEYELSEEDAAFVDAFIQKLNKGKK